jgi:hypothetical protein
VEAAGDALLVVDALGTKRTHSAELTNVVNAGCSGSALMTFASGLRHDAQRDEAVAAHARLERGGVLRLGRR